MHLILDGQTNELIDFKRANTFVKMYIAETITIIKKGKNKLRPNDNCGRERNF